ncbi:MAG: ATP-binding cassette domain-containing protein [Acidimicrobiales bacterium]
MGPNGAGKSTLANVLLGSPEYVVTAGSILPRREHHRLGHRGPREGRHLPRLPVPEEIPGVSVLNFLRQSLSARKGIDMSVLELRLAIMEWMERLDMDSSFAERYVNEGFSGGEKKRNEVLQMAILEPEMAILDETDSGLDIDALRRRRHRCPGGPARPPRSRRPRDHPLPATPRRAPPGSGARHRRRADRRVGWTRSVVAARGRRVRTVRSRLVTRGNVPGETSRPTSRSCAAGSTATTSSTSTPGTPRRSRRP